MSQKGIRILHVIRSLDPATGGPVEALKQRATFLRNRGVHCEVLCLDPCSSDWLSSWPVEVHALGPAPLEYGITPRLRAWLDENASQFNVLVSSGIWHFHSLVVRRAARKAGLPYFIFLHGALDGEFCRRPPWKYAKKALYWKLFAHKVIRDASAALFTSEEEMHRAHASFLPYQCNPVVVGNGIAEPPAELPSRKKDVLSRLLKDQNDLPHPPFLLFLARIHEKKGIDLLLKAFAANQNCLKNRLLVIAGAGPPQLVKTLQDLAATLDIARHVVWTGAVYGQDKWDLIRAAEAYVLPSHQENFGISVVEAMACHRPVLISDKVGIWRDIANGKAGLVAPDDVEGISQLLRRWAGLPAEERVRLGANARKCYLKNFGIQATNMRYLGCLLDACADPRKPGRGGMASHFSSDRFLSAEVAEMMPVGDQESILKHNQRTAL